MSKKYLFLLFLVLFNFASTVMADIHHMTSVDTDSFSEHEVQDQSEHESDKSHTHDQDDCHAGHVHFFLQTLTTIVISLPEVFLAFSEMPKHPTTPSFDIIKPPLLSL